MNLLFASDRLHVPDDHSGSVQSTHSLITALVRREYRCEAVASLPYAARHILATASYRLSGGRKVREWRDEYPGYPVWRGSQWRFAERTRRAVQRFKPDILVLDSLRALRVLDRHQVSVDVPIMVFVHDPTFLSEEPTLPYRERVSLIANSPWTARHLQDRLGIDAPTILPPLMEFERYQTPRSGARMVTLVSPHPEKGLELVLELASRMPDVPFLLVEGWPMSRGAWRELRARTAALPNVTLQRSTKDMREVYRETRVLLNPSEIETFGRVVVEAQVSGIPAIVRDVGALPWVVGEGGLVLPKEATADVWQEEIARLLDDSHHYTRLSLAARKNAARSDFDPTRIVAGFERLVRPR